MKLAISIALTTTLIAGTAILAAPGQERTSDRPGQLTRSSVLVDNRTPDEAIPVVVQSFRATSALPVQLTRQVWEYQTVTLQPNQDAGRALSAVGLEGWEATGIVVFDASRATVLLKRPR
jgi:hypothetical protein